MSASRPREAFVARPSTRLAILAVLGAGVLAGCAPTVPSPGTGTGAGARPDPVTVFAAASLKDSFGQIAKAHPELTVRFSFDGSNSLLDQLAGGARADVFASADATTMVSATSKGLIDGSPRVFAKNVLVLIVPADNPGRITGLNDTLTGKRLVVCAVGVPCGNATKTLASSLGVTLRPVSQETKVTDVRGKVESGEADAGLVYATDAKAAGAKVQTIAVPGAEKVVNEYPIAIVAGARNRDGGQAFIDAVRSEKGRAVLTAAGFQAP
ncbi:MAG: molybdate ABC transporter substrate-binding protein [Austwickia sp.]|nr:molybdate ABC transporter substrate-binding protein [Austwickia sp.]